MVKQIVVLGAGLASVPLIRQTMKSVVLENSDYKMIVVTPNTHFHWPIAVVRAVVPGQLPFEKISAPLEPHFKQYPAEKFELVLGKANDLDPAAKTVTVGLNAGGSQTVNYDTLIIATGNSSQDDMPWKVLDDTEKTKKNLAKVQSEVEKASKVVIAGGGITGSETAGELGFEYAKNGSKEVIFVYKDAYPLPADMIESARKQAESHLKGMNVKLIPNTTVTKATVEGEKTVLELTSADGKTTTLTTDAYIPAVGLAPNSSFAPASMLDSKGQIKQTKTLQAEGYTDIFVLGDVGSLEGSRAMMADAQSGHLIKALPEYLLRGKPIPEYQLDTKNAYGVTVGRSKGTGQFSGWKLPSMMVWAFKGRTLMTEYVEPWAMGKKTTGHTYEK